MPLQINLTYLGNKILLYFEDMLLYLFYIT